MTRIPELLPAYTDYLKNERQLASNTIRAYIGDLQALDSFVCKEVNAIERNDLRGYIRHMTGQGYKASTIRRVFHGMATFWTWAMLEKHVDEIITRHLQLPRKNDYVPAWMTVQELMRFVAAADNEPTRERLAWKLLAHTGMRPGELLGLRIEDVRLSDGVIIVRNTKSRRDRALPLPDALLGDFQRQIGERPNSEYVLGDSKKWDRKGMYAAFHRFLKCAGFDGRGFTPYVLRHTFGTLLASTEPVHVVKEAMGHNYLGTTERYLHASAGDLKSAMSNFVLNKKTETVERKDSVTL